MFFKKAQAPAVVPAQPIALVTLKMSLKNILQSGTSPLLQLVQVYDLCSVWQDELQSKAFVVSDDLSTHINALGRYEFGQNRTKRGQEVTADTVYLGNIYGLFTKTVTFWLDGTTSADALAIVERQANGMLDHARALIELI